MENNLDFGKQMHQMCSDLFPICRSITGDGVRETLKILSKWIPLEIHEVPSGTNVFDWTVPNEWNIRAGYIETEDGERIVDFNDNNLHVMGYSVPVDKWLTFDELNKHLISLPEQPDAIPYNTSFYKEDWKFCLTHNQRKELKPSKYHVVIDSTLEPGFLTYGDCTLKGESDDEILISSYVCHPSMANNELSGPVVTAFLYMWLSKQSRRFTYRFFLGPETIGVITWLSKNLSNLQKNVKAGFVLSCMGDDGDYSYIASKYEDNLADKVVSNFFTYFDKDHTKYSYLTRGSDERQYGSPGVELPVVTVCRSKFGHFDQYHTSLDDLSLVTPSGLAGGFEYVKSCIEILENNKVYQTICPCEPQLGKRGLYRNISTKGPATQESLFRNICAYADGTNDLIDMSNIFKISVHDIAIGIKMLEDAGVIKELPAKKTAQL